MQKSCHNQLIPILRSGVPSATMEPLVRGDRARTFIRYRTAVKIATLGGKLYFEVFINTIHGLYEK